MPSAIVYATRGANGNGPSVEKRITPKPRGTYAANTGAVESDSHWLGAPTANGTLTTAKMMATATTQRASAPAPTRARSTARNGRYSHAVCRAAADRPPKTPESRGSAIASTRNSAHDGSTPASAT